MSSRHPSLFARAHLDMGGRELDVITAHIPDRAPNGWDSVCTAGFFGRRRAVLVS